MQALARAFGTFPVEYLLTDNLEAEVELVRAFGEYLIIDLDRVEDLHSIAHTSINSSDRIREAFCDVDCVDTVVLIHHLRKAFY